MAGVAKAALETLCRYLAVRLQKYGTRVNAIRPGFLDTASSRATFGQAAIAALRQSQPQAVLDIDEVAKSCLALTSGYMDAVTGQVLVVDSGWSLMSPLSYYLPQANGN
jgi:enoyl-[acyl-carrier-protein] reductase (NADH)